MEGNAFDFRIPNEGIFSKYTCNGGYYQAAINCRWWILYQINEQDYVSANISTRNSSESFLIYTDSYLSTTSQQQEVKNKQLQQATS